LRPQPRLERVSEETDAEFASASYRRLELGELEGDVCRRVAPDSVQQRVGQRAARLADNEGNSTLGFSKETTRTGPSVVSRSVSPSSS
jgi:hypothetical protein